MVLLDQQGFLNALNRMYDQNKDKGSLRMTFKKRKIFFWSTVFFYFTSERIVRKLTFRFDRFVAHIYHSCIHSHIYLYSLLYILV